MAKSGKKPADAGDTALTRRYGSIAEIKREFFPNAAAADEAVANAQLTGHPYESLMDELFGSHQTPA